MKLSDALVAGAAGREEICDQSLSVNDTSAPREVIGCDALGAIFVARFGEPAAIELLREHQAFELEGDAFGAALRSKLIEAFPALGESGDALASLYSEDGFIRESGESLYATIAALNDELVVSNRGIAEALAQIGL